MNPEGKSGKIINAGTNSPDAENLRLKDLVGEQQMKITYYEELCRQQSERFALLNKYSIKLADQEEDSVSSFIVNEFKSLFNVKEVWLSLYDEKSSELVMKSTTLSEEDHASLIRKFGKSILGSRTLLDDNQYKAMIDIRVGDPSSLNEISFGNVPSIISSALETLFGIGWFQGITLTDKGKLFGGMVVAGYKKQPPIKKEELLIFSEITSNILLRKVVEKELVATKLWFRDLSDLLPQLVFEADLQRNITFINNFGLNLLGYTREDVKSGLSVVNLVSGAEQDLVLNRIRNTIEGVGAIPREINIIKKDGTIIPLLLHASLFKEGGNIKGIRGTGVDISQLREVQEQLSMERNLLRALIDNLPDRIYAKDTESRFIICNDALVKRVGKEKPEEIIGKSDLDLLPEESAIKYRKDELEIIETGIPIINKEEAIVFKSGHTRWSLSTKVPLRNSHGKIIGIVGIGRDITESKTAQKEIELKNLQLQELNATKDKFFSIIAHDLRSPFNVFLGLTQIISEDIDTLSHEEIKEHAERMKESASNLYSLLENLLEWSKMQRNKMEFRTEPLKIESTVRKSVDLIKEHARLKNIDLIFDIPADLEIIADIHMFETVIRNIVSNAIKYTNKGGTINISAVKTDKGRSEIRIKDSGIGMSKEMTQKLFTLDRQINRKGTSNEPSSGLGLMLCKEFVEKHGGSIRVESKEGKGSTFFVTI